MLAADSLAMEAGFRMTMWMHTLMAREQNIQAGR
jgi:hypothetical protein